MKARYTIKCCRCGYEWSGKRGTPAIMDFITDDHQLYRLCENCIIDLGKAETEEEKDQIIKEGLFVIDD